jgi:hypothetical protein
LKLNEIDEIDGVRKSMGEIDGVSEVDFSKAQWRLLAQAV